MQIYDNSNSVLFRDGFIQVRGVKNSMNPNDQLTYEVINKKDAVVCLVLSNDLKTIYTTKQFRPCNNDYELGNVAGVLDKAGKDHREIIIEEIEEEIRINRNDIEKLVYVGGGFSSSGMTTEFVHRYFAVLSKDAKTDETLDKASDTDSYDIDVAVRDMWCGVLKDEVKQMNAKLIVRPDSGDAIENIRKILHYLDDAFGSVVNEKGYKVLNKVGIINGDGVSINSLPLMLKAVEDEGFATCNVAYGIGGAMIQECNRDTFKYAIKCSAIMNKEGKWMDVYKDPKNSFKKSKRGLTGLYLEDGKMVTKSTDYDTMNSDLNLLKPVFENGKILKMFTLDEIRATISNQ